MKNKFYFLIVKFSLEKLKFNLTKKLKFFKINTKNKKNNARLLHFILRKSLSNSVFNFAKLNEKKFTRKINLLPKKNKF